VAAGQGAFVGGDVDDESVAEAAATAAGRELLALRAKLDGSGSNGKEIGAQGDKVSNAVLHAALAAAHPGDAVLSEESADDPGRLDRTRVWIIDPLDGTREYGEPGRTDWAVHVALVRDGALEVGVVELPAMGLTLSSAKPPALPPRSGPIRMVVSRTRPPAITDDVSRRLGAVLVPMGSAGAKAMSVLLGQSDVYLHAGGQHEWDSAAPVAVALAAGLHASRIDGSLLVYNRYPAWQPDLLICRPELASTVLEAIRLAS
jgi:3'(2'), 5'-bisphosphate nucleotidase